MGSSISLRYFEMFRYHLLYNYSIRISNSGCVSHSPRAQKIWAPLIQAIPTVFNGYGRALRPGVKFWPKPNFLEVKKNIYNM